ncbi:MAG TPA: hypothetical protein VLU46_04900 [Thermoanaerobaculia bacterium]|nr:hypothetical protein [Thermoanaerobaculia bacterium]
MTDTHRFAIVTRDELWPLERHEAAESRLIHGIAEARGNAIDARDDCDRDLLARCDEERERVAAAIGTLRHGRARSVVSAQREGDRVSVSSTISVSIAELSIATTLPHLAADYELLLELANVQVEDRRPHLSAPIAWRNGSAAVLLHEAAGHAAEHAHAPAAWPPWLTAADESSAGTADLLAGEMPGARRRQSFTDVPLPRMTNVVAGNRGSDLELPERRVDVLLVAGGSYEPLTETVTLLVSAADLVEGTRARRIAPFRIVATRDDIARSLRGAYGPIRRYPGVICSREGQELFVSSLAPDIVTEL